jgi:hypothetical protein
MQGAAITVYLRNVAHILTTESLISLRELNSILKLLGWDDVELDAYTLELVEAVLQLSDVFAPHYWDDIISEGGTVDDTEDMTESLLELERGLFGEP